MAPTWLYMTDEFRWWIPARRSRETVLLDISGVGILLSSCCACHQITPRSRRMQITAVISLLNIISLKVYRQNFTFYESIRPLSTTACPLRFARGCFMCFAVSCQIKGATKTHKCSFSRSHTLAIQSHQLAVHVFANSTEEGLTVIHQLDRICTPVSVWKTNLTWRDGVWRIFFAVALHPSVLSATGIAGKCTVFCTLSAGRSTLRGTEHFVTHLPSILKA